MKLFYILASLALGAGIIHSQTTADGTFRLEKKLIEYGWDVPLVGDVAQNIRKMEELPFDGLIFRLKGGGQVFSFTKPNPDKFKEDYANCEAIQWGRFTDNFIILFAASKQDWFNDDHWANIAENARLMTRAAKKARCAGICFDHEPYGFNPWAYRTAAHKDTKSFSEYEIIVRKRGAQFMKAVESEMPGLTVLTFFQFSYFSSLLKPMPPAERSAMLATHYYAFLPAFINGMLDVATPAAQIVDGNEASYYYTDSNSYFRERECVRQRAKLLVDEKNRYKYHNQMQVGQALYVDQYFDLRGGRSFLCSFMTPKERAQWFEHNIYWSLYTTDKYVWCYSEKMNWWKNITVPSGAIDAIKSAKKKISTGQTLGIDMKAIVERAHAQEQAALQKNMQTRKTEVKQALQAPVIDGKLDDTVWKTLKPLENFQTLAGMKNRKPLAATTTWLAYDRNNLYLAVKCDEPRMAGLRTLASKRDFDGIWEGDTLEFFMTLQPKSTYPFVHFIIDPNGCFWDAKNLVSNGPNETSFNPAWICKSFKDASAWYIEASIPWAELGIDAPAEGQALKGNICRQRIPKSELSSWSTVTGGFMEPQLFGTFKFVK